MAYRSATPGDPAGAVSGDVYGTLDTAEIADPSDLSATYGSIIPPQLDGLQLWLRADSLALSDGDSVSTWRDESGQGNDATQGTASAQPTYKESVFNGLPVVRFDGSNDVLDFSTSWLTQFLLSSDAVTIFFVGSVDNLTSRLPIIGQDDDQSEDLFYELRGDKAGDPFLNSSANEVRAVVADASGLSADTPFISFVSAGPSGVQFRLDGADNGSDATVPSWEQSGALPATRLGERAGAFYAGDAAEMIVYKRELMTAEIEQIETYLNDKYAIF